MAEKVFERKALRDFWLYYRKSHVGVRTAVVRASNLESAEKLGRHFCDTIPGQAFLSIEDPVVATEGEPVDQ